ncbi:MAG: MMPL family transporter, partial [Pseudomonadota bacterium]
MRDRFFNFLSWITTKHPWKIIIVSLCLFAAAVGFASTIKPKLSWLDLLPPDAPSVIEFEKILKLYGSSDTIVVSIEGDDPGDLAAFAGEFAEKAEKLTDADGKKLVKYVNYGEDIDFIRNHGLMLVREKDLERMQGSGMFDASGILHAVDTQNRDFKKEYVEEGGESLQKKENDAARAIDTMWYLPKTLRWFLENSDRPDDELRPVVEQGAEQYLVGEHRQFSDDRSILIIMVQPAYPSTDADHAIATAQKLRAVFEGVMEGHPAVAKNYPGPWPETPEWKYFYEKVKDDPAKVDKLRMQMGKEQPHVAPESRKHGATGMTGMHIYNNDEYSTMMHDMKGTNLLSFLAVFVLFVLAFRMWTSPLLAMGVLVFAITVGVALVAIVLGELNMMSMMFPVILIGLGIDYSIHIISGFTQLRRQGTGIEESMRRTFLMTGRGILTGALTTSMAFLALGISSFKGFSHLGISSGIGVLCTLAASFFILPPFLVVLHRWKDRRKARKEAKKKEPAGEDGLKEKKAFMLEFKALTTTGLLAYRGWVAVILVVVAISVVFSLRVEKVKMAKNMLDIEAKNLASVELNRVLSKRFFLNSDGSFVTADSLEQSDELHRKMEELGTVRLVSSIS